MKNPIALLFIHHSNDLYGADMMLLETVKGLDATLFNAIVILPEDCRSEGGLAAELEALGIEYYFLPLAVVRRQYCKVSQVPTYSIQLLKAVWKICQVIRRKDIALVHSNTLAICAGAFAARMTGRRHIWHVHEVLLSPSVVRRGLHHLACRLSSRVVCVSEAVRRNILRDEAGYAEKLTVIHNGVPLEKFGSRGDGRQIRKEFGIPDNAPLIGMVGRVNPSKGQVILAEAAKLLLGKYPDAYFICVGSVFANEQRFMDSLKSQVAQIGVGHQFIVSEFRSDIPNILAALDVYAHPSILPESFGLVVVEAMAAGKVTICAAHGGPLEIVENNVTGILVEPGSAAALAAGIAFCLEDRERCRTMGDKARERAFERFHIHRYLEDIQQIYEEELRNFPTR